MDNQRLILVISLVFMLFLIWQAWVQEQMALNPPPETSSTRPASSVPDAGTHPTASDTATDSPVAPPLADVPNVAGTDSEVAAVPTSADGDLIKVVTDQFVAWIDPLGGSLIRVGLNNYPEALERQDQPFLLLNDGGTDLFIAQSGLIATAGGAPDHYQTYQSEQREYSLPIGQDRLEVPLSWSDENGVKVIKTYTFQRDRFVIDISHQVENDSAEEWRGSQYRQLQRRASQQSMGLGSVYTYTGGVISTPEKNYEKIDFDDMLENDLNQEVEGGWIAMIQHYFLGAWIPQSGEINNFYTKSVGDNRYVLGMVSQQQTIPAGDNAVFNTQLYVGPKIQDRLEVLAPQLNRTVDYGWLWFIAEPLFWLLKQIHQFIGNWGWSIIILTIMIKAVFYKLSETSYRSMANMRKMAPRMQQMKERYGDDRAKLNQAMMEMYKKEKINPLGGCLPIVVQIPVFIALYWMLLESVELRQAPWLGWIQDLAIKDPYYILPIIMGVSMFAQQRLNPTPPDPIQAKVMMALPFVFTFFFLWFPAGLVLYWVTNNLLSIAQQYVITKRVEAASTSST